MKHSLILFFFAFSIGLAVESLRCDAPWSGGESPVSVDVCFLFRNSDLVGSRRFITSARIASALPHGSILESDSCPKRGSSFAEQLDRPDFDTELNQRFRDDPYGSVPVLFEGTLYRPTFLRRLWFGVANIFGVYDHTPLITVRLYKAVGKRGDSALIALPDSHP